MRLSLAPLPLALTLFAAAAGAQEQYKRVHQAALRKILAGELESAERELEQFAQQHPLDAETPFVLGLALAARGEREAALAEFEQALALGLPPGRLHAEPRELLAPLAEALPDPPLLVHGPMLGALGPHGCSVWVRLARAGEVVVRLEQEDGEAPAAAATARATVEGRLTAVVRLEGLAPATRYRGDVLVDGRPAAALELSTAPTPGSSGKLRVAFGGGAGYVPEHERAWDSVRSARPDLLLLLGDNVYSDDPKSPPMQRYCYARRQSRPEFRALVGRVPVYAIWDDHDFGTNDCWGGPEVETPAWKRPVFETFRENWVNPAWGGGEELPGCWFAFQHGDVELFLLDGRMYRTDPGAPEPSMLGPVQLAWLQERLLTSQATFKLICSPVPFDYRTKGKSKDTWNGYRAERERLFGFLAEHAIEGVLLVSADRHRSDAWLIEREGAYDLFEFNSSRLTNQHTHPRMKSALFSYNARPSFGLLSFDTAAEEPSVSYEVVNIDGETVERIVVLRSQLR